MSNKEMAISQVHLTAFKELSMSSTRCEHIRGLYLQGLQTKAAEISYRGAETFCEYVQCPEGVHTYRAGMGRKFINHKTNQVVICSANDMSSGSKSGIQILE